jgi:hypothetical protein
VELKVDRFVFAVWPLRSVADECISPVHGGDLEG